MRPQNYTHRYNSLLFTLTLVCLSAILITACGDSSTGPDNNNNDNGTNGSDEPTFANVQQILTENCGNCHIGNRTSGVRLDSYENVMGSVGDQYGGPIVIEGEPDNSPLVDKIESDPSQGARMPQGGPSLSTQEITLIRNWIEEGAQNN
ncbi:c-type cytochrome domain-containing protein [Fodinibius sediminis]|uniref:Planctomycete cytochrome C n=1 Tax=Fodinibius sediminis TaxID=1214077 RepID=A0A521B132_9BACT|nr:c-type cytochrome domain-containing protein [Fodinibius sediminis]SMO40813.1 Planctomycete cytochrome C [Fodinibius sediminis]